MTVRFRRYATTLLLVAIVGSLLVSTSQAGKRRAARRRGTVNAPAAGEWAQWRGPERDGKSKETGLLSDWEATPPSIAWQTAGLGKGFASVSIADGKIYSAGVVDGQSQLIAMKLSDGSRLWSTSIGLDESEQDYVSCTPTVDDGRVYAIGFTGALLCADANTGEKIWQKDFAEDFGGKMMSRWGFSESPLIDGDRLLCTPGGNDAVIVALNKKTGDLIWKSELPETGENGKDGAGYSSIVISNAGGRKQYVQLVGRGVIGVDAKTGKVLWTYNRVANGVANIPTPVVSGDYVFCSTGYGTGAALLKINRKRGKFTAEEIYFLEAGQMQNHHGGMILLGDYVYFGHGHNKGFPRCIHMPTGEVEWKDRGPGSGSAAIGYADGHLYYRFENGIMALIEANPEEYKLKGTFEIATVHAQSWPHPVISGGKLYLRDQDELHCYDISAK